MKRAQEFANSMAWPCHRDIKPQGTIKDHGINLHRCLPWRTPSACAERGKETASQEPTMTKVADLPTSTRLRKRLSRYGHSVIDRNVITCA